MKNLMPVTTISLRMGHHAARSGYDRIIDYLSVDCISTANSTTWFRRAVSRALRSRIEKSASLWYQRANKMTELATVSAWMRSRNHIYHFLYGENSYRYTGCIKKLSPRNNKLIATFHTPSWRMREVVQKNDHLKSLDHVIVMASSQKPYFQDLLGPERVHFIPHGVDTDYFSPKKQLSPSTERFRIICVGSHLRDFNSLKLAAQLMTHRKLNAELVLVSQPKWLKDFAGVKNVTCCANVTDEELLALYQSVDALLLPLLDATANNALMEGMACGLPIIATDLPGIRDYISADRALLIPDNDPGTIVHSVERLIQDTILRKRLSSLSRETALLLDWRDVATQTQNVYQTAMKRE